MGNTQSNVSDKIKFGSIYGKDGKVRPGYYVRNNAILYKGNVIDILPDEKNFQKLNYGYAKSSMRVFYNGKYLPFADPLTFSTINRKNKLPLSRYSEKNKELAKLNCVLGMDYHNNKKRIYLGENVIYEE